MLSIIIWYDNGTKRLPKRTFLDEADLFVTFSGEHPF